MIGIIFSLEERRWPIEAAAIPLPSPERTPPVPMMYLVVGILFSWVKPNEKAIANIWCGQAKKPCLSCFLWAKDEIEEDKTSVGTIIPDTAKEKPLKKGYSYH